MDALSNPGDFRGYPPEVAMMAADLAAARAEVERLKRQVAALEPLIGEFATCCESWARTNARAGQAREQREVAAAIRAALRGGQEE